jgi:hypothetical protein
VAIAYKAMAFWVWAEIECPDAEKFFSAGKCIFLGGKGSFLRMKLTIP